MPWRGPAIDDVLLADREVSGRAALIHTPCDESAVAALNEAGKAHL